MAKLIKFYSQTCPPCNMLASKMESMGITPDEKIDIASADPRVEEFGVMGVPVLVHLDDDGHELARVDGMGMHAVNFLKQLQSHF